MPTYDYKCTVCDERFEVTQSIHEDSLTIIDGCEWRDDANHQVKKVFGAVSISFKGSGFYRNDSRGKSSSTDPSTSSKSSSESSGDSTSSADSPAKTETKKSETNKKKDASTNSTAV